MSALVKGVFSGDTILLQGLFFHQLNSILFFSVSLNQCAVVTAGKAASATATAPERQLTLTNITAPRFSRSKNVTDEPFAFESREWLRKKCLGKVVSFRVVHQHPSGREYGIVTVDGEDLASALVSAGWASARAQKEDATPSASKTDRDALTALEAEAKAAQRGMHAFTAAVAKQHVRSIDFAPDARALFDRYKGKVVAGSECLVWVLVLC
jgi:endonuclease YncB( thermonuclease family)